MKKIIIILIIVLTSVSISQKKNEINRNSPTGTVDSLRKNIISVYAEKSQGMFGLKTTRGYDLLFCDFNYNLFTSHANLKIDNTVYSQEGYPTGIQSFGNLGDNSGDISGQNDTNKLMYKWANVRGTGIEITEELIPRENIVKKVGAILIKYTIKNNSSVGKYIGLTLKLDTKIGGLGYLGSNDPTDKAPIASSAGLIKTIQYIKPIPDFWLAFENPSDTNAMIGRGVLKGKDLTPPDRMIVGDYANRPPLASPFKYYGYCGDECMLTSSWYNTRYDDSELLMEWNTTYLDPGVSVSYTTLYGMGEIDYQGNNFRLYCKNSQDSIALQPNGDYDNMPFEFLVNITNKSLTVDNVVAKIKFNPDVFYLDSPPTQVDSLLIGRMDGGETKVASWKLKAKNQVVSKDELISVIIKSGSSNESDTCSTPIFVPANKAKLSTVILPNGTGTLDISPLPGVDSLYSVGKKLIIEAKSGSCYRFSNWTGDIPSTNSVLSFGMDRNIKVVANFVKDSFAVNVIQFPLGINATILFDKPSKNGKYECGTVLTIKIDSNSIDKCYKFKNWDNISSFTSLIRTITVTNTMNLVANFEKNKYTLTTSSNPTAGGTIKGNDSSSYLCGSTVSLTAIPNSCYEFINWTRNGIILGTSKTFNDTMNISKIITANYSKIKYNLTTSVNPVNSGTITGNNGSPYDCNSSVRLSTTPNACYEFSNWTKGNEVIGSSPILDVIMDTTKNIVANFAKIKYNLTLKSSPRFAGKIQYDISNSTDSSILPYLCGDVVKLTAKPTSGYKFIGWNTGLSSNIDTTITINNTEIVIAKFENDSVYLKLDSRPITNVKFKLVPQVTPDANGYRYRFGDSVKIQAISNEYCYKFKYWSWAGDLSITDTIIAVKMDGNKSYTANFEKKKFKISILPFANGTVKILPTPPLDSLYNCDTILTFIAKANKCYSFDKWNYSILGVNGTELKDTIQFTLFADIIGKPDFKINNQKLRFSAVPFGSATINNKLIDTTTHNCGDLVTLTVNPDPCFTFLNWTNGDTSLTTKINITSDSTVKAILVRKRFAVITQTDYDSTSGKIVKSLDSAAYDCGSKINLTINPSNCYNFISWSGDTSSIVKSIPIFVNRTRNITANMAKIDFKFNTVENKFPNVILNFQVDSTPFGKIPEKITSILEKDLTIKDKGCGVEGIVENYKLLLQTDNTYKIVYALTGCFDKPCDTSREASILFHHVKSSSDQDFNCNDINIIPYNINLNSGCDSCSRLLKRITLPLQFKLYPNHPNPFNPETKISFSIATPELVKLIVYDILGREVSTLVNEVLEPGMYEKSFVPANIPTGMYFYRIKAGKFIDIKKMLYVK